MEHPPTAKIRALFFDLDGTLLTSKKEISPGTLSALHYCACKGIGIFAATARPPHLEKQLGLSRDQSALLRDGVFLNGAFLKLDGKTELRCIGKEQARRIIEIASGDREVNIALQLSDGRHAFRYPLPPEELRHWGLNGKTDIEDFTERSGEARGDILKILCFERWEGGFHGKRLDGLRDALHGQCRLHLSDGGAVIQAMESSVSKKSGVERIMARSGLLPEEIAVFGDDVNDAEMLSAFPHSVAMGNAPPEVASLARYKTASNDEDGIAWALRNLFSLLP